MKLDTIVKIEKIGKEKTIDISTDGNNLFYANGILTHNCGYNNPNMALEDTSESSGIAHTADFIHSLWQEEGDKEQGVISSTILKNRYGIIGKRMKFSINYNNLTIDDYDNSYDNEEDNESNDDVDELLNTITR